MDTNHRSAQTAFAALIAGVAIFSFLKWGEKKPLPTGKVPSTAASARPPVHPVTVEEPRKPATAPREEYPELVAKYGADRVALSKTVATQSIELFSLYHKRVSSMPPYKHMPIEFQLIKPPVDAAQEAAILRAMADLAKRGEDGADQKCEMMKSRQGEMMAHYLAIDAHAKGRMDDAEYRSFMEEEDRRLRLHPLPGLRMDFNSFPPDEELRNQLKSILTAGQYETGRIAKWVSAGAAGDEGFIETTPLEECRDWRADLIKTVKAVAAVRDATRDDEAAPDGKMDFPAPPR